MASRSRNRALFRKGLVARKSAIRRTPLSMIMRRILRREWPHDTLRFVIEPLGRAGLLPGMRRLVRASADERLGWMRDNLQALMTATDHDAVAIHALSGVSPGTVRNFLRGTDSSLGNVMLIALALGVTLGDLERPPEEFQVLLDHRLRE